MPTTLSRWGEHGARPTRLAVNEPLFAELACTEVVLVDCSRQDAWALVSDVARIGEFSPECVAAHWIGPVPGPRVGARFEGTNRIAGPTGDFVWIRPNTVVAAEPGRSFGFVVGDRYDGTPASHWLYRFADGCRIELSFHHVPDGLTGLRLAADGDPEHAAEIVTARMAELKHGMRVTLAAMKVALEAGRSGGGSSLCG